MKRIHTILILLAAIAFSNCSTTSESEDKQMGLEALQSPAGEDASLPYLVTGEDGKLYFSWVEKKDS